MNKRRNWISFLLVLALVVMFAPTVARAAEGDPLTLTVKDNDIITVTSTGYTVSNQGVTNTVDYTGSYIFTGTATGTNSITIEGLAEGAAVTMQDLSVTSTGPIPMTVNADTTIAASGSVSFSANSPAIYLSANLTITGDADITVSGNAGGIIKSSGSPVVDITCKNLSVESGSVAVNAIAVTINAAENISLHSLGVNAVSCGSDGSIKLTAGGNISLTSVGSAPTVNGAAELNAGGFVTIANSGTGMASTGALVASGTDIAVTCSSTSPALASSADLTASGAVTVANTAGMAVNGKLTVRKSASITVTGATNSPVVAGGAELHSAGDIVVTNPNGMGIYSTSGILVDAGGDLRVESAQQAFSSNYESGTQTTLKAGGTITVNCGNHITVSGALTAEAGGGILIGNSADMPTISNAATLTAGGDISVTNGGTSLAVSGDLTASGNNITVSNGDSAAAPAVGGDLTLDAKRDIILSTGFNTVTGGKEDISFGGTLTRTTSEGTSVEVNVAQVGDKKYTTLGAAVEAAQSGEDHTVTMLADTAFDGFIHDATVTGTVTIALNGHTLESYLYIDGGSLTVTGSGTVTNLAFISGTVDLSGAECLGWSISNWGDEDEDDNLITVERLEVGKNLLLPGKYVLKNYLGDFVTYLDADAEDATVSLPPVAQLERTVGANTFQSAYTTLDEAIEYAETAEGEVTVTLLDDVDQSTYINSGKFTFDLNGHTLTSTGYFYTLVVQNAGTEIVLIDSSEEKTGKIDAKDGVAITVDADALLTIRGGTFCGNYPVKIGSDGQNNPAALIVEGGNLQGEYYGLYIESDKGVVTVQGGSISGEAYAIFTCGNLTITGTPKLVSMEYAHMNYQGGTIDLSGAKCSGWSIENISDQDLVAGTGLLLPEDYCLYNDGDTAAPVSKIACFAVGIILDHVHTDSKANHLCDICEENLSGCQDENDDHLCDICDLELTSCTDGDGDYVCDICNAEMERPVKPECPKDETCVLSQYADIKVDDWYHDGIHFCVDEGIMNGMGDGVFAPNEPTTRAQLVTMLYRLEGKPSIEVETEPFTDVNEGEWYYDAIVWAYSNKVVNGMTETTFEPNGSVTREQVATILYRYLDTPAGTGKLDEYPDVDKVQSYAKDALVWAVGEGLINGVAQADGTSLLDPAGNATRAQIATILMRYLTK